MRKLLFYALIAGMCFSVPAALAQVTIIDQPISTVNDDTYANQKFDAGNAQYNIYMADDFVLAEPMEIHTIFVPAGAWNPGGPISCATTLNFEIYADAGGVPDGHPEGGNSPVWSFSAAPSDTAFTISTGATGHLTNVLLTVPSPSQLPTGTYWLVFYPDAGFSACGQFGRNVSDTTNGNAAMVVNPGGGFGFPSTWAQASTQYGFAQSDIAFAITGMPSGANYINLTPGTSNMDGEAGETVTHSFTLTSNSGEDENFDLSISGETWVTSITSANPVFVADGSSTVITVDVVIPPGAEWPDADSSTLTVVGQISGLDASSILNTGVISLGQECSPGAIWSQPVLGDINAYQSDNQTGQIMADDFTGLTEPITAVEWWGIEATGSFTACNVNDFEIIFYQDGTVPGAIVDSFNVTPIVMDSGLVDQWIGLTIWKYRAELPTPVDLSSGWVSIAGDDVGTGCYFWWIDAGPATGNGAQVLVSGTWSPADMNGAFCLFGETVPTPTPEPTNTPVPPTNTPTDPTPTPAPPEGDAIWIGNDYCGDTGDQIEVEIWMSNESNAVDAFTMRVEFDNTMLDFVEGIAGDLDPGWTMFGANEADPGVVTVAGFSLPPAEIPAGSEGVLAILVFDVTCNDCDEGDTSDLIPFDLLDDIAGYDAVNGMFTFICPDPDPTPTPDPDPTPTPDPDPTPTPGPPEGDVLWIGTDYCGDTGDQIEVEVWMMNETVVVDAFTMAVLFDNTMLDFVEGIAGDLDPGWTMFGANEADPGVITVAGFSLPPNEIPAGSEGVLAILVFDVTCNDCDEGDTSELIPDNLRDDIAGFDIINGMFTFICPEEPTPTPEPTDTPVPPTNTPTHTPTSIPPTFTPTPTPTQPEEPTPTPTQPEEPTPTPEPDCDWFGTRLELSQEDLYRAGDEFWLRCHICVDAMLTDVPTAVLLGVYGEFWFWPSWEQEFDLMMMDYQPGLTTFYGLEPFIWPTVEGHVEGLEFYAAMLTPDMTNIFGDEFGYLVFGYTDQ